MPRPSTSRKILARTKTRSPAARRLSHHTRSLNSIAQTKVPIGHGAPLLRPARTKKMNPKSDAKAATGQAQAKAPAPPPTAPKPAAEAKVAVRDLTMAYGAFVVMKDLNFEIAVRDIFVIMGGSGCGKSTLLRHLIGLQEPAAGSVFFDGDNFTEASQVERQRFIRRLGVMYQSGALWSSLTLAENISLPLEEFTDLSARQRRELVSYKLSLVGLAGYEEYYPSQVSGGMNKRAGIARAMALDPDILFLDEPGAGLDPLSSRRLDDLILRLRDSLGSTVVIVTHELASIFNIATNSIFLDNETHTQGAIGNPKDLRDHSDNPAVRRFLNRGKAAENTAKDAGSGSDEPPSSTANNRQSL
jgi:phospholipid/cholesterol/gamma-HCH transport system ATP-binding protein